MSVFATLVASLSEALEPAFHASATAAAIVLFTLGVRLALHPLARAAVRGEKARARLAPRVAELRRKHGQVPERLREKVSELYRKEGASPVAGCLPMLFQVPVFFLMFRLFTSDGALLGHTLLGARLGGRWADALADGGLFGGPGLVYAGLFALTAAVATWTFVRGRRAASAGRDQAVPALARQLPLLSFATLVTVAVVPLAAALYVVTSSAWTAVERAALGAGRAETRDASEGRGRGKGQARGRGAGGGRTGRDA